MKTKLQALRKQAGYRSAREFAETHNMKVGTYTDYEQGRTMISLERAWHFADVLGEALGRHVSLDELAGRDWPPPGSATTTAGMDARLARINEQYAEMNERGKVRATESVDDIHANPQNRAGVSPEADELPAPSAGAVMVA